MLACSGGHFLSRLAVGTNLVGDTQVAAAARAEQHRRLVAASAAMHGGGPADQFEDLVERPLEPWKDIAGAITEVMAAQPREGPPADLDGVPVCVVDVVNPQGGQPFAK